VAGKFEFANKTEGERYDKLIELEEKGYEGISERRADALFGGWLGQNVRSEPERLKELADLAETGDEFAQIFFVQALSEGKYNLYKSRQDILAALESYWKKGWIRVDPHIVCLISKCIPGPCYFPEHGVSDEPLEQDKLLAESRISILHGMATNGLEDAEHAMGDQFNSYETKTHPHYTTLTRLKYEILRELRKILKIKPWTYPYSKESFELNVADEEGQTPRLY
jgi:hypothetical protein